MFMQIHQIRERDLLSKQYQQQQGFMGLYGGSPAQANMNHYYNMMMQQQAMNQGLTQHNIRAEQYHPTSTQSANQNLDIHNVVN